MAKKAMETHNLTVKQSYYCLFLSIFVIISFQASFSEAETHYHEFVIQAKPVKRLCRTHNTITVNGLFPGPTLEVRDGDTLVIKAINNAIYNVTLHCNPMDVLRLADFTGAAPNVSDAYTINGQPGDLYRCSKQAHAYNSANAPFDNTTTTAILEYKSAPCNAKKGKSSTPIFPQLPGFNDTNSAIAFTSRLRSPSKVKVPLQIDENLFFTVGVRTHQLPQS
ncbi:hypothetical protein OIU76_023376 [Salix suchowensis]|nr:hypothetical protein OIU76_023376 [Salix suchowensis]